MSFCGVIVLALNFDFAGTMFLNKSLSWFCNEEHHGKVPMDDVGGTMKDAIFRKVKSGQIVVHTPK